MDDFDSFVRSAQKSISAAFGFRTKGGEGSGYFDHPGRPGEVGGSLPGGGGVHKIDANSRTFRTSEHDFDLGDSERHALANIEKYYAKGHDMSVKYQGDFKAAVWGEDLSDVYDSGSAFRKEAFRRGFDGEPKPEFAVGWRYGEAPRSNHSFNHRDQVRERGVSFMGVQTQSGEFVANPDRSFEIFNPGREMHVYKGFVVGKGSDGEPLMLVTTHLGPGKGTE